MVTTKRLTGSSAKTRRGNGWGGKGSVHPTADRIVDAFGKKVPCRYRRPFRGKPGRGVTQWVKGERQKAAPHCGAKERWRRLAALVAAEPIEEAAQ
jgi:hypothetical protein